MMGPSKVGLIRTRLRCRGTKNQFWGEEQ